MGEKLGEAEWIDIVYTETSGEEEAFDRPWISISENELRGSVRGSVFAAKGFDPGVMLCMRDPYSAGVRVFMYDCGITDKNGKKIKRTCKNGRVIRRSGTDGGPRIRRHGRSAQ